MRWNAARAGAGWRAFWSGLIMMAAAGKLACAGEPLAWTARRSRFPFGTVRRCGRLHRRRSNHRRLLALAVRFEGLLQEGTVRDYADLARLGGVSRARITQIMSLRHLHGPNQLITYLLSIHYAEHRRRETADGQRP